MNRSTPGLPVHHQHLEFTQTHVHRGSMPSSHLILWRPILLLPSIFPSITIFSNESALCIRWQKYWSFSFNIRPSNEHPGLISFRTDWLDLLAVQGTHKSLLQHHSSKASILQHSTFFTVQLSHPFTTTGKTIAVTRWTFVGKVMSLLVELGYLFDFFLVSWGMPVLLWAFPLALLLQCPIGFGLLCFQFHSFICIFWFLFLFLLWLVGYLEACCLSSICWNFYSFFPVVDI